MKITIGRYPAPVVAAIGCGVHPACPALAVFLGEFHCIPLKIFIFISIINKIIKIGLNSESNKQEMYDCTFFLWPLIYSLEKKKYISYLTCCCALLLMERFSARLARLLSKSPVKTFPLATAFGC